MNINEAFSLQAEILGTLRLDITEKWNIKVSTVKIHNLIEDTRLWMEYCDADYGISGLQVAELIMALSAIGVYCFIDTCPDTGRPIVVITRHP